MTTSSPPYPCQTGPCHSLHNKLNKPLIYDGKDGGMEFHREPVLCLDIHPDNKHCVTGGADGQVSYMDP